MTVEPKIIKTEAQYRAYLEEVNKLAGEDPLLGTPEGDRLELLAKLIEDYELEHFKFEKPSPVEAIRFRMEEQGFRQKDLAPILGGKNRVSEVLSGKRPLTVSMVRALNQALHIPAELLISDPDAKSNGEEAKSISAETLGKMHNIVRETSATIAESSVYSHLKPAFGPLFLKRTITYGATSRTDKSNLRHWVSNVRDIAERTRDERGKWTQGTLSEEFLKEIARLSADSDGPAKAREHLAKNGIALVILPKRPRTHLDGAAMLGLDGSPVIGLTIRHNRLDNFWFTLVHELVHVWKHLPEADLAITDEDIELQDDEDENEAEANRLARDSFIPRSQWKRSEAFRRPSTSSIMGLAQELHIHPAIVAGRLRREKSGYAAFSKLVGHGKVRELFPEVKWS